MLHIGGARGTAARRRARAPKWPARELRRGRARRSAWLARDSAHGNLSIFQIAPLHARCSTLFTHRWTDALASLRRAALSLVPAIRSRLARVGRTRADGRRAVAV